MQNCKVGFINWKANILKYSSKVFPAILMFLFLLKIGNGAGKQIEMLLSVIGQFLNLVGITSENKTTILKALNTVCNGKKIVSFISVY